MGKREVVLPWIPDYFTIAIYPQGNDYIASELQSGLFVRDMISLTALRKLSDRLMEVRLAVEKAQREGYKVSHPSEPREVSAKEMEAIRQRKGIVLRNVVIEPP